MGYVAADFIKAIAGSGGVKYAICDAGGFCFLTLQRAIRDMVTVRAAYEAERSAAVSECHSILWEKIKLDAAKVKAGIRVDTSDIRWFLSKQGKAEGWADTPIVEVQANILTLGEWRKKAAKRLESVQGLLEDGT